MHPSPSRIALAVFATSLVASAQSSTTRLAPMVHSRTEFASVKLQDGRVLVTGGMTMTPGSRNTISACEILTLPYYSGRATCAMQTNRSKHVANVMGNGKVLVAGGWTFITGPKGYPPPLPLVHKTSEVFDPATETWQAAGDLNVLGGTQLASVTLADGRVLVVGTPAGSATLSAEVFDPATLTFRVLGDAGPARVKPTLTLLSSGRVLITGASYSAEGYANTPAVVFNPATATATQVGAMTALRTGKFTTTRLFDGRVLVVGGDDDTTKPGTAEVFQPTTGQFTFVGRMSTDREGHTANLLPNGNVVILGGYGITNRVPEGAQSFAPPIHGALATGEVFYPAYSLVANKFSLLAPQANHRAVVTRNGNIVSFGGETDPGTSVNNVDVTYFN